MRSFLEEAKLLARIRHPNVVSVLNFTKANATAYLVMKHEDGCSLHEHIYRKFRAGEALREEFLRSVFVRLLGGLREVHKQKLLHLDLKPANIFLRRDGNPVLLDFGAARWGLGEAKVNLGNIYTLGFAAPEQQQADGELGPWTDIYAIGATLYSCLSGGATPLPADRRLKGEILEPAEKRWARQYSPQLLEVIDWCLRLPIMARPQSIHTLQKMLSGELLDIVDPGWFRS
jgi:serine/threonine protein kinase